MVCILLLILRSQPHQTNFQLKNPTTDFQFVCGRGKGSVRSPIENGCLGTELGEVQSSFGLCWSFVPWCPNAGKGFYFFKTLLCPADGNLFKKPIRAKAATPTTKSDIKETLLLNIRQGSWQLCKTTWDKILNWRNQWKNVSLTELSLGETSGSSHSSAK